MDCEHPDGPTRGQVHMIDHAGNCDLKIDDPTAWILTMYDNAQT